MVVKTIEVKVIDSYIDLKKVIVGDLISIKGKTLEIVINPDEEFHSYKFSELKEWKNSKLYTVGVEGPFVVLNQYDLYVEDSDEFLVPYFKTSCRISSGTPLADGLRNIVKSEGLLR